MRRPETRNSGSDDNGPDIARERQQPEIGEKGRVGGRNVFGCGVRCSRPTLLDLSGPVACDCNIRRVRFRVLSLRACARWAVTALMALLMIALLAPRTLSNPQLGS